MSKTKAHIRYKDSQGKILPGVTTIIAELGWNKQALIKWANNMGLKGYDSSKFRDEKANVGKLVHEMILDYLRGCAMANIALYDEYTKKEIEQADNSMISFYEWEKGHKLEPISIEEPVINEYYCYGGTPDFYGYVNGELELIDFKTGSGIYDEYIIQVSAYMILVGKAFDIIDNVRILRIPRSEDEAFEERLISERELEIGWNIFKHCLKIYQLRKQWKGK